MTLEEALEFIDRCTWSQCSLKRNGITLWMNGPQGSGKVIRAQVRRKKAESFAQMIIRAVEVTNRQLATGDYYEPRFAPKPLPMGDYWPEIVFGEIG